MGSDLAGRAVIIFLYGTDGYRLIKNRDDIIARYRLKHPSGINISAVAGGDSEAVATLETALKSRSFFNEVRMLVVNDIFSGKQSEKVAGLLKTYGAGTDKECVILATHFGTAASAKPKELFAILADKKNLVRNIEPLQGSQLANWLKKEAAERGAAFAAPALRRFLAVSSGDSWQMVNNLEKLANYCRGVITREAVDRLIRTETEPNIFDFIEAVGARDRAKAFGLLYGELAYGRDPYYLLTMIAYQFRNMLTVRDLMDRNLADPALAKQAGLHPFVVRKIGSVVSRHNLQELKNRYRQLLELELAAKNGQVDLADALYVLALGA